MVKLITALALTAMVGAGLGGARRGLDSGAEVDTGLDAGIEVAAEGAGLGLDARGDAGTDVAAAVDVQADGPEGEVSVETGSGAAVDFAGKTTAKAERSLRSGVASSGAQTEASAGGSATSVEVDAETTVQAEAEAGLDVAAGISGIGSLDVSVGGH